MALAASMSVLNAKITERSSFDFAGVDGDRINPVHIDPKHTEKFSLNAIAYWRVQRAGTVVHVHAVVWAFRGAASTTQRLL